MNSAPVLNTIRMLEYKAWLGFRQLSVAQLKNTIITHYGRIGSLLVKNKADVRVIICSTSVHVLLG